MAKEENPPAFIDYEGAKAASESATKGNAFADCKRHWKKELFRVHRIGGVAWSIIEQTNLSRLLKEFEPDEVKLMMTTWVETSIVEMAARFNILYKERYKLHEMTKPKEYDW